jgi:hypothetical protein
MICPPSFLISISLLLCPSSLSLLCKLDSHVTLDGHETYEDVQVLKDKHDELESILEGKNEVKTCDFITCTLTEESDYEEGPDEEMHKLMDVEDPDEEDNNAQQRYM